MKGQCRGNLLISPAAAAAAASATGRAAVAELNSE